jgi:hypothetical protein
VGTDSINMPELIKTSPQTNIKVMMVKYYFSSMKYMEFKMEYGNKTR